MDVCLFVTRLLNQKCVLIAIENMETIWIMKIKKNPTISANFEFEINRCCQEITTMAHIINIQRFFGCRSYLKTLTLEYRKYF